MVRSRMLVPTGQMVTRLRMVRPLAMAMDSGVMAGPIRQEAPSHPPRQCTIMPVKT
jgi:hypothetical protein